MVVFKNALQVARVMERLTRDQLPRGGYADYVSSSVHSDRVMCRWSKEDKEMIIDTLSQKADGV